MFTMTASQHQTTLDGKFTSQKCVALFSIQGLINHLVELVVSEDDVFLLLDKPVFWQLIQYLCPSLPEQDIPHRTKIHEEVLAHAVQAESRVKIALQVCLVFVCQVKY